MTENEPRQARFEKLIRIEVEAAEAAKAAKAKAAKAKVAKAEAARAKDAGAKAAKAKTAKAKAANDAKTVTAPETFKAESEPDPSLAVGRIESRGPSRTRSLKLRLTDDELEQIKRLAAEEELPVATFARSLLPRSIGRSAKD